MERELQQAPCQGRCAWSRTDAHIDQMSVFSCSGCGSEWVHSEPWTPRNAGGDVSDDVAAERAAHPVA